jgi:hypothetical protein
MPLNEIQRKQLLAPLNSGRVATRDNLSYLEQWDVRRTLIRIFGFGNWDAEVLSADLVFESQNPEANKSGKHNWDVAYKVILRLTVWGIGTNGEDAVYTEAAIGASHQPDRAEAHDMAVKTAESDALKRCAVNLGTQFGLSLYQKGANRKPTLTDVVMRTLDVWQPEPESLHGVAISEAAAQHQSDHIDFNDPPVSPEVPQDDDSGAAEGQTEGSEPDPAAQAATEAEKPADDPRAVEYVDRLKGLVADHDVPGIIAIKAEIAKARAGRLVFQGQTLAKWVDLAVIKAGKS